MHHFTARELRDLFLKGEVSAHEIATHFIERIEAKDGFLGAFLSVLKVRALEKARKLDQKRASKEPLGKLAAIPIAIKDNIHIKGEITTCASKFLAQYRAVFDSTVCRMLEEEDALLIGKTNLDEFAMGSSTENSAMMITKNPWNVNCVPGGSSGGSSAAVAARLAPLALGSDTGGSVRQPAAFCGIFGFKPTYGRVSRYGLVAFGSSLDQIGPMAYSAEDIALIMEVMGRHDPRDATSFRIHPDEYLTALKSEIEPKRIGVPWSLIEGVDPEVKENFQSSIQTLQKLGCEIVDIHFDLLKYSVATYYILATAEASTNLARFDGIRYGERSHRAKTLDEVYDYSKGEGFGTEVKKRILLGTYVLSKGFQDAYYKQATKVRATLIEEFNRIFDSCDLIATPTSPNPPFLRGAIADPIQMYLQDIYTIAANLAYLPAISIPSGFSKDKRPIGLQLMGAKREDLLLVRLAHGFEQLKPYSREIPEEYK